MNWCQVRLYLCKHTWVCMHIFIDDGLILKLFDSIDGYWLSFFDTIIRGDPVHPSICIKSPKHFPGKC
jgi:hypothetical protein